MLLTPTACGGEPKVVKLALVTERSAHSIQARTLTVAHFTLPAGGASEVAVARLAAPAAV